MTDDFDIDLVDEPAKCREAQFADALVDLSRAVDLSRNEEVRALLIKAMDSLVYQLNPPRGELKPVRK
jgi:hypothetical protein